MILHLDLDCFFAAAHRINNPTLLNIPIAVGGRSNLNIFTREKEHRELSNIQGAFTSSILSCSKNKSFKEYYIDENNKIRGIITTSSYEARAFGVKTAMSVAEALRHCPSLKMIAPNYPLYHDLSYKLKILLEKKIPQVEQFSIDEFFGDVSGWVNDDEVYDFANKLKIQIQEELGLPISIGIAKTKWIAKLATNKAKPFGVKLIIKEDVEDFIKNIPIEAFPGIGAGYEKRLRSRAIKTLGDVKHNKQLFTQWGTNGLQLYNRICGFDNEKISFEKRKKSIGLGRSFDAIENRTEIKRRLNILCRHLSFLAFKASHNPMTYSLKIKYEYGSKENDNTNTNRLFSEENLKHEIISLFNKIDIHPLHSIVQLNITLGNFAENKHLTLDLFNYENDKQKVQLSKSLHKLRDKFGIDIIKNAGEL